MVGVKSGSLVGKPMSSRPSFSPGIRWTAIVSGRNRRKKNKLGLGITDNPMANQATKLEHYEAVRMEGRNDLATVISLKASSTYRIVNVGDYGEMKKMTRQEAVP